MAAAGRGVLWTEEESTALLQIWKEDYINYTEIQKSFFSFPQKWETEDITEPPCSAELNLRSYTRNTWPYEINCDVVGNQPMLSGLSTIC